MITEEKHSYTMHLFQKQLLVLLASSLLLTSCGGKIEKSKGVGTEQEIHTLDHLVISEVFYFGTWMEVSERTHLEDGEEVTEKIPARKYGQNDSYIKVTNPTSEVKYLDGLALGICTLDPAQPLSFKTPSDDFTKDKVGVSHLVMFPGSGKDHPLKPGESILLAAAASNHKQDFSIQSEDKDSRPGNPNSFDLSKADWEWLSEHYSDADRIDDLTYRLDNKQVKNMIQILPEDVEEDHFEIDQNLHGLVLLDLKTLNGGVPESIKKALTAEGSEYAKTFSVSNTGSQSGGHSHGDQVFTTTILPKDLCIDAVVICPREEFAFSPLPKSLDKGAFGVNLHRSSNTLIPDSSYGKSIKRKHDGHNLVDDNNSMTDFEVADATL